MSSSSGNIVQQQGQNVWQQAQNIANPVGNFFGLSNSQTEGVTGVAAAALVVPAAQGILTTASATFTGVGSSIGTAANYIQGASNWAYGINPAEASANAGADYAAFGEEASFFSDAGFGVDAMAGGDAVGAAVGEGLGGIAATGEAVGVAAVEIGAGIAEGAAILGTLALPAAIVIGGAAVLAEVVTLGLEGLGLVNEDLFTWIGNGFH